MKRIALIILVFISTLAWSQIPTADRMNLQNLLAERAKNFSEYTGAIQKRSGIFGNKSKRDIQKTNEILIQIVTLDNDIMNALNRALSYKTFEKTTDNYNSRDCEMKLQKSMEVTDTLTKQLMVLEKKIKKQGSSSSTYQTLFYTTLVLLLGLLVLYYRKREIPS